MGEGVRGRRSPKDGERAWTKSFVCEERMYGKSNIHMVSLPLTHAADWNHMLTDKIMGN